MCDQLNQMERSQLTVFIQQHPLEVYRPPSCDVLCIKKSIVEHFELMASSTNTPLPPALLSSESSSFSSFSFFLFFFFLFFFFRFFHLSLVLFLPVPLNSCASSSAIFASSSSFSLANFPLPLLLEPE